MYSLFIADNSVLIFGGIHIEYSIELSIMYISVYIKESVLYQ